MLRELVEHWPLKRGEKWRPASTGSLTKARSRLGAGALRVLFDRVGRWAEERDLPVAGFVAEAALDYRHRSTADGRLGL
ncbi:hypothetical protein GCM10010306_060740 [Streptomyces umbrinus]|uniref:transposase domain-containing protein n=1 Tax=Streptomyces umbrinus TaxID=67370 RepID=UPI0019C07651|nr:transposase domain-containing protein [Streptomyces umbrinus]GHB59086.1 hypothetical protein GCM10010306_060740 [Streptomyces umbrinus]